MPQASRFDEIRNDVQAFHNSNPGVWGMFVKFTYELIRRGFKHYSVKAIFERIRWESDVTMTADKQFRLNNNYTAFYARRFMKMYPQHNGFFRTREQISKSGSINHNPTL